MRVTNHALERWRERHPCLSLREELAAARRPSKRVRYLLAYPATVVPSRHREPRRYLITDNDVVFVLDADDTVVTVLKLREAKRRAKAMQRERRAKDASRERCMAAAHSNSQVS